MRRFLYLLILMVLGMAVHGSDAEAKRRGSIPTSSSNPCVERDDEGTCIKRRRDVERERRDEERRAAEARGENANTARTRSQDNSDGSSWLYYGLAAVIMFGGGAFKLLRRGVGAAAGSAASYVRAKSETPADPPSEWATKATSRFSRVPEPEPTMAAPAGAAPAHYVAGYASQAAIGDVVAAAASPFSRLRQASRCPRIPAISCTNGSSRGTCRSRRPRKCAARYICSAAASGCSTPSRSAEAARWHPASRHLWNEAVTGLQN